jgi:plasmid stabilization system protein ParE
MKRHSVVFALGMSEDLNELEDYIALESTEEIAALYIDTLIEECESLEFAPFRGTRRPELRPNMRIIGFKHAVSIVFRIEEQQNTVVILGVSYRGRSIDRILGRNE